MVYFQSSIINVKHLEMGDDIHNRFNNTCELEHSRLSFFESNIFTTGKELILFHLAHAMTLSEVPDSVNGS